MDEQEIIELKEVPVILYIPENAVSLTLKVRIIDENEEIIGVEKRLQLPEITEARILGEEWEGEHAVYALTPKGEEYLESLRNN